MAPLMMNAFITSGTVHPCAALSGPANTENA